MFFNLMETIYISFIDCPKFIGFNIRYVSNSKPDKKSKENFRESYLLVAVNGRGLKNAVEDSNVFV